MNLHPFFFPSLLYASIHTISIATTVKEESTASNRKKLQRNVPPLIIGGCVYIIQNSKTDFCTLVLCLCLFLRKGHNMPLLNVERYISRGI